MAQTEGRSFLSKNRTYILVLVGYAIMLIVSNLSPFSTVTPLGMTILGIYAGTIFLWATVSISWPSLISMILVGLSSYEVSVEGVFTSAFGNSSIHMMVAMMCFAYIIRETGLVAFLYAKMMKGKFINGHPWRLTVIIMLLAFVGSMLTNAVASMFICWAFVEQISKQVGYKKGDKWPVATVAGITMASVYGNCVLPYQMVIVSSYGMMAAAGGKADYDFGQYFAFSAIYAVVLFVVTFLVIRFIYRPDVEPLKNAKLDISDKEVKLNGGQKIALSLLAALVLLLMAPSYLPQGNVIRSFVSSLGTTGVACIMVSIACLLTYNGKPIATIRNCFNSVAWEAIIMVACAVFMSGVLVSEATGVKTALVDLLSPLIHGSSAYLLLALLMVLAIILTNIINNIVVISVFIPIVASVATAAGINTIAATALIVFSANTAYIFPSGGQFAALLHSNEMVTSKEIYKFSSIFVAVSLFVVVLIGIPLANAIFR